MKEAMPAGAQSERLRAAGPVSGMLGGVRSPAALFYSLSSTPKHGVRAAPAGSCLSGEVKPCFSVFSLS